MTTLFDPIRIGDLELPNRIVMAPLTRLRANALMAEYYVQRASAGLIITEATAVTPQGVGYADTLGIWTDEQVAGWRQVTDAVHAAGGASSCYCGIWAGSRTRSSWTVNCGGAERYRRRRPRQAGSARAPLRHPARFGNQ